MAKTQRIAHESHSAAWDEIDERTGKVVLRGHITTPAIYNMKGVAAVPVTRFMERYNVDRGEWVSAERELQKLDLPTMVRYARAMPDYLRVVVLDPRWRDPNQARVILDRSAVVKGDPVTQSPRKAKKKKRAHSVPRPPAPRKPQPRRAPAVPKPKRPGVTEIKVPARDVPMIQPVPVERMIADELGFAAMRGKQLGGMAAAFARAVAR